MIGFHAPQAGWALFWFYKRNRRGCGNVEISRCLRDFQGTVGRGGKLLLLFHAFHGPIISTALSFSPYAVFCATGDSVLQRLSNCPLAAVILRAHSVSLIFNAASSSRAKLIFGFKYFSA